MSSHSEFETSPESGQVSFCVPGVAQGWRLDRALGLLLDDAARSGIGGDALRKLAVQGVRARRRLCERGLVLVGGRPGVPGLKLRAGQEIVLLPDPGQKTAEAIALQIAGTRSADARGEHPFVVHAENGIAALFKPAGLHSAALSGSAAPSLEALLPALLPECAEESFPRLLNRLDAPTSGLVLAALKEAGVRFWRRAENAGRTDKRYLAVIEGQPLYDFTVGRRLDTDGRARTRVRHTDDSDSSRHTSVTLLAPLSPASAPELFAGLEASLPLMLVGCRIRRGARHQIRAHLAAAGHPLLGDTLYGGTALRETGFLLHHASVTLPEFSACRLPFWLSLLPGEVGRAAEEWLRSDATA